MNCGRAIVAVTSLDCPVVTLLTRHFQLSTDDRGASVAFPRPLYALISTFLFFGKTACVPSGHEHASSVASTLDL